MGQSQTRKWINEWDVLSAAQVLSQLLCYNNHIKIEDAVINFEKFSTKVLSPYHSYLKMAGSYHGSISNMKIN